MNWITPKTNWQPTDHEGIDDFNRQANNIEYAALVILPQIDRHPQYDPITRAFIGQLPIPEFINQLEINLAYLKAALPFTPPDWGESKTWTSSYPAPNYQDAQRWEKNTLIASDQVKAIKTFFPYAAMYSAGGY